MKDMYTYLLPGSRRVGAVSRKIRTKPTPLMKFSLERSCSVFVDIEIDCEKMNGFFIRVTITVFFKEVAQFVANEL